jgi:UDP-N-acetylmuramyl pentapeptide phosphotransferase/UDP-N-acetylglucosamine-1-phosphate transferase
MKVFFTVFVFVFFANAMLVHYVKWRKVYDFSSGVQKFHKGYIPRVGGVAVYIALWLGTFLFYLSGNKCSKMVAYTLISAFPVFIGGVLEDVTKKVSPMIRLLAGFISGLIFIFLMGYRVNFVGISFLDYWLSYGIIAILFTSFAISGVSHALNIIDGFNGLAAGVGVLVFLSYAYVSYKVGDRELLYISLLMLSALIGFLVWNYPFGFIFLGDGGAYLIGFLSSVFGIILVNKHRIVSPWFPLMLLIYPVWETIFSAYRRKFLKRKSMGLPDAVHFHTLIYRRLIKLTFGAVIPPIRRNAYTSPYLWSLEFLCVIPAIWFWDKTNYLIFFVFLFIVFYVWLYFRIVKFRTPNVLKRGRKL